MRTLVFLGAFAFAGDGTGSQDPSDPRGWYLDANTASSGMVCISYDPASTPAGQTVALIEINRGGDPCLVRATRNENSDQPSDIKRFVWAGKAEPNVPIAGRVRLFLNVRVGAEKRVAMVRMSKDTPDNVVRIYIEPRP
jgi:hypothetical protein